MTVALVEMGMLRTPAGAVNKECVHDHQCLDGRICARGICLPSDHPGEHGPPVTCPVTGCPDGCFCGDDGYCHRIVIVNGEPVVITVTQTVVVGGGGGGGSKRHHKRRRHHRRHR